MKLKIFDYGMNGEGVAKLDGKVVLIPNTLIGEEVEGSISSSFPNYSILDLTSINLPSDNRCQPKCKHYLECGGCQLQHMKYDEQLKFKSLLVKKTIKKITGLDIEVLPTTPSTNQYNYRNKVSFSISNFEHGFFKEKSNILVPIDRCEIIDERMNDIASEFSTFLKENNITSVRNLVIRIIDNQILIGVVSKKEINLTPFYNEINTKYKNIGLDLIINTRKDSVVLTDKLTHITGIKNIKTNSNDINYDIDILGFQQTNLDIQNKIYSFVKSNIDHNEIVVNAFSGQGLLSAEIAKSANKVYGIEINKFSHIQAENLKKFNKINNLFNILGDFSKKISSIPDYNTLILDPSKKGCGEILKSINCNKIIYISCNPIALSKDLRLLLDRYRIETVKPFDMFPQTSRVETVVILNKK